MPLDPENEARGLAKALRRREIINSELVRVATIADLTAYQAEGWFVAELADRQRVMVHAWTTLNLFVGMKIFILRVSDKVWNTYVLIAGNGTTDPDGVAYTKPVTDGGSLSIHALDGPLHSGSLAGARVDYSNPADKVDLSTDVTGLLPVANQAKQTSKQTFAHTLTVGALSTVPGTFVGCANGLVRKLTITGGNGCSLVFYSDDAATQIEYQTTADVATPFTDAFLWFHEDAESESEFRFALTNTGGVSASFTITVIVQVMEA